jgi:hypothetical protein
MAKKKGKKDKKGGGSKKAAGTRESRELFAGGLHRAPTRWDVLVHQLALRLEKRVRTVAALVSDGPLKFRGGETEEVGWIVARALEVMVQQRCGRAVRDGDPWNPASAGAAAAIAEEARDVYERLLRKYVEDELDLYPPRPYPDLTRMATDLAQVTGEFFAERTAPGADLFDCVTAPASPDEGYFPPNRQPAQRSTGEARRDLYELGLVVRDDDGPGELEDKLLDLVRYDPWLFAECRTYVDDRTDDLEAAGRKATAYDVDAFTEEFMCRATHLDGKTPVQLLLDRQVFISDVQRRRLEAWASRRVDGVFRVQSVGLDFLLLEDVRRGQEYQAYAARPELLESIKTGGVIMTGLVPWDRRWYLSGPQHYYNNLSEREMQDWVLRLKTQFPLGPVDPQDPQVIRSTAAERAQYDGWVARHGTDEVLFTSGHDARQAVQDLTRSMVHDRVNPETGKTPRQSYLDEHGKEPPDVRASFPENLLDANDVGIVYHPVAGMSVLEGYGQFRSAFAETGPLTPRQVEVVWGYLRDDTIEYWLFQRMAERYPARAEAVLREVLRDPTLEIARDLDGLLRKFKGEQLRIGLKPSIVIVDDTVADQLRDSGGGPVDGDRD